MWSSFCSWPCKVAIPDTMGSRRWLIAVRPNFAFDEAFHDVPKRSRGSGTVLKLSRNDWRHNEMLLFVARQH